MPSAFLVENCNLIYISGLGAHPSACAAISTNGLPTTANAYKPNTDGKDFYLMVLKENATLIHYATFFGANQSGSQSGEHVDGGTSRFDKDGIVYQAICAGCGADQRIAHHTGHTAAPIIPPIVIWPSSSSTCRTIRPNISPEVPPQVCLGTNVNFENLSTGGISTYGILVTATAPPPSIRTHTYDSPRLYNVMLVAYQPSYCFSTDTAYTTVEVEIAPPTAQVTPVTQICPGTDVTLQASGGSTYQWLPGKGWVVPNSAYPIPR